MKSKVALEITLALGVNTIGIETVNSSGVNYSKPWIQSIIDDLKANRGKSIVTAGGSMSPDAHALVHAINEKLGNTGNTVHLTMPLEISPVDHKESLNDLVYDMNEGQVDLLIMIDANPLYDTPADLDFAKAMERVAHRVHMGLTENETSEMCQWHVPESHYLESWGDIRAYNGLASVIQPLIKPLYKTHSHWNS